MDHPFVILEVAHRLDNLNRMTFMQTSKTIHNVISYYFRKEIAISTYLENFLLQNWSLLDCDDKLYIKKVCTDFLKWLLDCGDFKRHMDIFDIDLRFTHGRININSNEFRIDDSISDFGGWKSRIIPHINNVLVSSKRETACKSTYYVRAITRFILNYWNQLYYDSSLRTYTRGGDWVYSRVISYYYPTYLGATFDLLVINLKPTISTHHLKLIYKFIHDTYCITSRYTCENLKGTRRFTDIVGVNFFGVDKFILSDTSDETTCVDYSIPNIDENNFYKIVDTLFNAYLNISGKDGILYKLLYLQTTKFIRIFFD